MPRDLTAATQTIVSLLRDFERVHAFPRMQAVDEHAFLLGMQTENARLSIKPARQRDDTAGK